MKIWREIWLHGLKTTDREGEIDKCFWQMERQHNGRTKIKKDAFYIFQWDERRRRKWTKWPRNKRGLVPKARSCKPSFLFQRKIVIKAAQRLQQVLIDKEYSVCLTVRYELPRSSLFFHFDDGRNEGSDTKRRIYIYIVP